MRTPDGMTATLSRPMRRPQRWLPVLCCAALLGGCVAYPYYPDGTPVAAADAGVQVTDADRASGRISGVKAGAAVSIGVQQLADGRVQVSFQAPASREANPSLDERWLAAYNRRMGR